MCSYYLSSKDTASATRRVSVHDPRLAFGRPEECSFGSRDLFRLRFSRNARCPARSWPAAADRLLIPRGTGRSEGFGFGRSLSLASQSRGLQEDALELFGDRRPGVGLIEDLVAPGVAPEDAGARQLFEVSGYGALGDSGEPDKLPDIEGLVGVGEEPSEKPPAGLSKEHHGGPADVEPFSSRTHFAYYCT
jgi:hypothetical protein